jgi:transposase-like protein
MAVLTDLRNRGVKDVFFVVCDGLKGLPEVVGNVWPQAIVQTCIIHLIRNTFRLTSRKYWDEIKRDIKPIYTAINEADARAAFDELAEKWGQRYPAVIKLWDNAWAEFIPFLDYDVEIRRVICSTDEIVKRELVVSAASGLRGLRRRALLVRPRAFPRCVVACRYRPRQAGRGSRAVTVRRRRARADAVCG